MNHFDPDMLEKIFQKENWFHDFTVLVARESAPDEVEKQEVMVRALEHVNMEQLLHVNKAFNDMTYKMSRFACFTTKSDNLPMWNHYAQGYTGVCLEYDTTQIADIYAINRLFPVYYVNELPDMPEMSMGKSEPPFGLMDYFLIHKLGDWSYEDEWRLIYNIGSWYFSLEDTPETFWDNGKAIPFLRPSRILLGPKMEPETEALLRKACAPYQIPVVGMECTEYGLQEAAEDAKFC